MTDSYPVTPRNRVKREQQRASYDHASVHAILDSAMLAHVAYVIDGQPFCTPTIHWRKGTTLYWHGSAASRMLRHLRSGTPACVSVSHVDGLVLARSGFNHSLNYRSVMCFGTARLIEDPEQKAEALVDVVDRFYPGRSATLRGIGAQELKATSVIAMQIDAASAKVRAKGPGDAADDLAHPVWAGVIPVARVIGAAQDSVDLPAGLVPGDDLSAFAEGQRLDAVLVQMQAAYEGS